MVDTQDKGPLFTIPLPGGRTARVPLAVLEQYVDKAARSAHAEPPGQQPGGEPKPSNTSVRAGEHMITVNIYAGSGEVVVRRSGAPHGADDDVSAHSLSVDGSTGTSDWHTDWEFGECEYTDESGFPQRLQAWHRHPFGTEYSELYEGG